MAAAQNPGLAPIWPLSVNRYHAMIEAGILSPDDRVELLEGVIVEKLSKDPAHRIANRKTLWALERVVPNGWYVDGQEPVTLARASLNPTWL